MDKQPSEKRFALLIDADNVSAKYIKPITDELSNYGTVTIKRIYGDWTLSLHAKWKDALLENSLTPIQQFGYTQGKNATDSAMIIDAMDILYTGSVDGFCIVSSDSDFTRLASRLRESGRMVIGMGEKKTPTPFRRACDVFTTLELLLDDANGKRKGKGAGSGPSIEEVEQAVVRIITDNQNNGKATGLGEVGSRLLKRFPDFDVRSYGTNLLSKLLGKFASVTITKRGSDVSVELVDDKEQSKEAPREADASASDGKADKADKTEKAEKAEKLEKAGEPAEESSDAEAKSEEDAAQAEDASDSSSRRRRRRRGGTRASRRRSAAESAEPTAPEDGDAPSEPEEAVEIPEEQITDPEQGEKAEEGAPEQETSQQKAAEQKASQQDTSKQEASEVDASQSADETPRPKAQKPKRKTRRGAKKDDGASHESASAKAGKRAFAEDAKSGSSEGAEPASAKGAKHDSGKGAKPSSGKNAKPGSDKAGKPASAEAAKPASELAEVDATTRRLVAEAGAAGIEMSQLASLVRAAHRGFKVRDHGHAQFKSYVASLGDIEIERIGKEWFARMGE